MVTFTRRLRTLLAAAALSVAVPLQAGAMPIHNGETLEVKFGFSGPPDIGIPQLPPNDPWRVADVLYGILNATYLGGFGAPQATFALYDGASLLGSFSLTFAQPFTTFAFSSPTGLFNFRSGIASDFSAIIDGTIDGRLLITSTSPADFDFSVSDLQVGHATQASGFIPFSPGARITEQSLLTPPVAVAEPATAALLLAGLTGIAAVRRRSRRGQA